MKLVIITGVSEFQEEIKRQLKKANVTTYSYKDVVGYRDSSEDALESNWFSSEMNESQSVLFFAFVEEEKVDGLFESINGFNTKQETLSHIHVAVLNIEKSN